MQKYFSHCSYTLEQKLDVLNRVGGPLRFDHTADQEVLLLGHGRDSGPFGQQHFFGIQRVQIGCESGFTVKPHMLGENFLANQDL
jgi:hypothetical protein